MAMGYDSQTANILLGSLRKTGYMGDIFLLVGEEKPETLEAMNSWNAKLRRLQSKEDRTQKLKIGGEICQGGLYKRCFITDYRDVFFQVNPFDRYPAGVGSSIFRRAPQVRHSRRKWPQQFLGQKMFGMGSSQRVCKSQSTSGGVLRYDCGHATRVVVVCQTN